jgi:2-iminobutanoate/2-iminopropanoate deaminase
MCAEVAPPHTGDVKLMRLQPQVNVFLDDMAHFAEMNGVFEKYFAHKPARSCVAVKQLPKGVPVEIECIAYTGEAAKL